MIHRRSFLRGVIASLGALEIGLSRAARAQVEQPRPVLTESPRLGSSPLDPHGRSPLDPQGRRHAHDRMAHLIILPFCYQPDKLKPGVTTWNTTRTSCKFQPERVIIRNSSDWIVNDFTIAGRCQLVALDEPGDKLTLAGSESWPPYPRAFDVCDVVPDVRIAVTYVGPDPEGEHFCGGILGHVVV